MNTGLREQAITMFMFAGAMLLMVLSGQTKRRLDWRRRRQHFWRRRR